MTSRDLERFTPGKDCDCILGQTDYCEDCEEWVKDCPCWQEDTSTPEDPG